MGIHTITLEQTADVPKKVLFGLLSDHENLGRFFLTPSILSLSMESQRSME